ncbi:hypothetical protein LCGC14_2020690 [marine sediment metagenome]|uniref:Uncharacterized protein n=1 Tax=marine sediment metagenome TaxID=412755 RepID=A0A0F9EXP6_9ZZZZ
MDDGGPAFPQQMLETDRGIISVDAWGAGGMSLREHIIIEVLKSLITTDYLATGDSHNPAANAHRGRLVAHATAFADLMISQWSDEAEKPLNAAPA